MSTALNNLEARENSVQNHLFVFNSQNGPPKVLFSLHAPGPYASFSPVLGELIRRQMPVACGGHGRNDRRGTVACISSTGMEVDIAGKINADFPNARVSPLEFTQQPDPDLFIATFDPREQRLLSILRNILKGDTKKIVAEDYPGDCRQVIAKMLSMGHPPSHILVPMTDQTDIYKRQTRISL